MEQIQHKHGLASFVWPVSLLIGFAFAFKWISRVFEGLASEPIQWALVGEGLAFAAVFIFIYGLVAWFLSARRGLWSLALVVTLIAVGFIFLFVLGEFGEGLGFAFSFFIIYGLVAWFLWAWRSVRWLAIVVTLFIGSSMFLFLLGSLIGGLGSSPFVWTGLANNLMSINEICLPFLAIAWLLWFRPMIGAVPLICLGVLAAVGLGYDYAAFSGLLIVLGILTLIQEVMAKKGQAVLMNAG